ncbi:MAG: H-X9-DG-CTERM domain-containing protein, partial [Thermoguttaceae bacterium]
KAIPRGKVNSCSAGSGHWDCTFMTATSETFRPGLGRSFTNGDGGFIPIARLDDDFYDAFGSWHTGVCNFALGDGSVRGISTSTPPDTVLYPLSRCDDGKSVSLP